MAAPTNVAECVEDLLYGFTTYDRAVDVVSAFEMIYTDSATKVPTTVAHFERFPRIPQEGSQPLTPDFTVVFHDGGGLAGEVARLALPEESVDELCAQIQSYDALRELPDSSRLTSVEFTDLMLLVPQSVGVAAVRRIILERFANPEHWYAPEAAPCVVQFGLDEDRYIFQRLLESKNGMPRDRDREDGLSRWFEENGDIKVRPGRFSDLKAERAFMNDPIDRLYLATHLWAKTFPTMAGEEATRPVRLEFDAAGLAAELRSKFGGVRAADVEHGMELLKAARLADRSPSGWVVAWEEVRVAGEKELAHAIATRACRPPQLGALAPLASAEEAAKTVSTSQRRLF